MKSIKEIEIIANKARLVFENNKLSIDRIIFEAFPHGACGAASEFLGKYLIGKGFSNVECVYGNFNEITHAWLGCDRYIIDITIDQFCSTYGPIYFNRSKIFHKKFINQTRKIPEITDCLGNAYHKFYKLIEEIDV